MFGNSKYGSQNAAKSVTSFNIIVIIFILIITIITLEENFELPIQNYVIPEIQKAVILQTCHKNVSKS